MWVLVFISWIPITPITRFVEDERAESDGEMMEELRA
jgi:hypothetical protein